MSGQVLLYSGSTNGLWLYTGNHNDDDSDDDDDDDDDDGYNDDDDSCWSDVTVDDSCEVEIVNIDCSDVDDNDDDSDYDSNVVVVDDDDDDDDICDVYIAFIIVLMIV